MQFVIPLSEPELLIKSGTKTKKVKVNLGSWGGLKIVAIGPQGGKIVGYTTGHKPIYAGSSKAKSLINAKKSKAKDGKAIVDWLVELGIPAQSKGSTVGVSPKSGEMVAENFGVTPTKKTSHAWIFDITDLTSHIGQPLTPKDDEHASWAAGIAAGDHDNDPFPELDSLKEIPAGKYAGSHGNKLFKSPDGKKWIFKGEDPTIARAEEAASRISRLIVGDRVPAAKHVTVNNQSGVLIQEVGGEPLNESNHSSPPMPKLDAHNWEVAEHFVADWLTSNHDGHAGNFLSDKGHLNGIDKGQAWKFFGKDKLSASYSPNPSKPIYNKYWKMVEDGLLDPKIAVMGLAKAVQEAEKISIDQFKLIVAPYVATAAAHVGFDAEKRLNQMAKRLETLRADVEEFATNLLGKPVSLPKKGADNFETMPEVEGKGGEKLTITEPDKPKVIEGGAAQPIVTEDTAGWPITKKNTTIHHPGNPVPEKIKWPGGLPGPGFTLQTKYKGKQYTLEASLAPDLKGPLLTVYYPDGSSKAFNSLNKAGDSLYLWENGLSLDMNATEKKKAKVGLGSKAWKLDQFKAELAQAHSAPKTPTSMTPDELVEEKFISVDEGEMTPKNAFAKMPDGLITDMSLLPFDAMEDAKAASEYSPGSDYEGLPPPGTVWLDHIGDAPIVNIAFMDSYGKAMVSQHFVSFNQWAHAYSDPKYVTLPPDVEEAVLPSTKAPTAGPPPEAVLPENAVIPKNAPGKSAGPLPVGTSVKVQKKFDKEKKYVKLTALEDGAFQVQFEGKYGNVVTTTHKSLSSASDHVWVSQKGFEDVGDYKSLTGKKKIASGGGWKFWGIDPKAVEAKPQPSEVSKPKTTPSAANWETMPEYEKDAQIIAWLYKKPIGSKFKWVSSNTGKAWEATKTSGVGFELTSPTGSVSKKTEVGMATFLQNMAKDVQAKPPGGTTTPSPENWGWFDSWLGLSDTEKIQAIGAFPTHSKLKFSLPPGAALHHTGVKGITEVVAEKQPNGTWDLSETDTDTLVAKGWWEQELVSLIAEKTSGIEGTNLTSEQKEEASSATLKAVTGFPVGTKVQGGDEEWSKVGSNSWEDSFGSIWSDTSLATKLDIVGIEPTAVAGEGAEDETEGGTVLANKSSENLESLPIGTKLIWDNSEGVTQTATRISTGWKLNQGDYVWDSDDVYTWLNQAKSKVYISGPSTTVAAPAAGPVFNLTAGTTEEAIKEKLNALPVGTTISSKDGYGPVTWTKNGVGGWKSVFISPTTKKEGDYTFDADDAAKHLKLDFESTGVQPTATGAPTTPSAPNWETMPEVPKGLTEEDFMSSVKNAPVGAVIAWKPETGVVHYATKINNTDWKHTKGDEELSSFKGDHFDVFHGNPSLTVKWFVPGVSTPVAKPKAKSNLGTAKMMMSASEMEGTTQNKHANDFLSLLKDWKEMNPFFVQKPSTWKDWVPPPGVALKAEIDGAQYFLVQGLTGHGKDEKPGENVNFYIVGPGGVSVGGPSSAAKPGTSLKSAAKEAGIEGSLAQIKKIFGLNKASFVPGESYDTLKAGTGPDPLPGESDTPSADNWETMPKPKKLTAAEKKAIAEKEAAQKAKIEQAKKLKEWGKTHPAVTDHEALHVLSYLQEKVRKSLGNDVKLWVRETGKGIIIGSDHPGFAEEATGIGLSKTVETPLGSFFQTNIKELQKLFPKSGTIKGPDGKTYPKGTKFKKVTTEHTVEELLPSEPGFNKFKEHKDDDSISLIKVAGSGEDQMKQIKEMLKKYKVPYEGGIVKGSSNCIAFVKKEHLQKVGKTIETVEAKKPKQPPSFSQASVPGLADFGAYGDVDDASIVPSLQGMALPRFGKAFTSGPAGAFRDGQLIARRVRDKNGTYHTEITGTLASNFKNPQGWESKTLYFKSAANAPGVSGEKTHNWDEATGASIESDNAYADNGFKGSTSGGSSIEIHDDDKVFKGVFRIRVEEGSDLQGELTEAFEKLGVKDALKVDPNAEDIQKKWALVRGHMGAKGWKKELANPLNIYSNKWLDEQIAAIPNGQERLASMERKEVFQGHSTWIVPDDVKTYKDAGWKCAYRHDANVNSIYYQLSQKVGWASRKNKLMMGNMTSGWSPSADITSGGADSNFFRIADSWSAVGSSHGVVMHPRAFLRTDWRRYYGDAYGNITGSGSGGSYLSGSAPGRYENTANSGSEVVFNGGSALEDIMCVIVDSTEKTKLIKMLNKDGITEINGVPLDDFILVGSKDLANRIHPDLRPGEEWQ